MNLEMATEFFKNLTIVVGVLYLFTAVFIIFGKSFVINTQRKFFKFEDSVFEMFLYGYLGIFKLFFLFFVLGPYVALTLIA